MTPENPRAPDVLRRVGRRKEGTMNVNMEKAVRAKERMCLDIFASEFEYTPKLGLDHSELLWQFFLTKTSELEHRFWGASERPGKFITKIADHLLETTRQTVPTEHQGLRTNPCANSGGSTLPSRGVERRRCLPRGRIVDSAFRDRYGSRGA